MNAEQRALWSRLQAHVLDDPASTQPFSLRLAKENGWLPGYTQRVMAEYRRFAFLAVAAGHPVSPPDAIDQAWHLHLLYTRDYWGEFCPRVLGTSLRHGPARGGAAEKEKFGDWYARTLASYRQFFGEPPADLWPMPASHPRTVRVDLRRNWIVAKPKWFTRGSALISRGWHRIVAGWARRRAGRGRPAITPVAAGPTAPIRAGAGVMLGILFVVGAFALTASNAWAAAKSPRSSAEPWNPMEMAGTDFLGFFIWGTAIGFVAAAVLRYYLRVPGGDATGLAVRDSYEAAFLGGGPDRAFVAAVARLNNLGLIGVREGKIMRHSIPAPDNVTLLERTILESCDKNGTAGREVRALAEDALQSMRGALAERGLAMHGPTGAQAHLLPLAVAFLTPAAGVAKICLGLMRSRPVSYLVVLEIFAFAVAFVFFLKKPLVSRRGRALLRQMKTEYAGLKAAGPALLERRDADAYLPLAVGLFGTAVLANTPLAGMDRRMWNMPGASSSGSCSSSSDSSGGDSGGGDGGGSGCGGCGGGD